ncbi:hypothetical protein ACQ4M3_29130 [Leptolyngbya sp. AN03gr2]|uniref:hypothetical protein n=1 Tax=unclassified Leptolyngbya TaxID=2650499 RepID=UPI003D312516
MSRSHRIEPLPADPVGKRLCQTFSYRWMPIVRENEPDGRWRTLTRYPLRPRELWKIWQDAAELVGVRFGSQTSYALIDLDKLGQYHPVHNSEALPLIRAALETIGITRTFLTQSSWSGGLHLWIPLPELVPTFGLATALQQCLEAQHFQIKAGAMEIFPNCKSYGANGQVIEYNGHRLPLQPSSGSFLLDDDLQLLPGGLERFFVLWDAAAEYQDMPALHSAIALSRKTFKRRRQRQVAAAATWRQALLNEIEQGWTDFGQTNALLKSIACYGVVFEGLDLDDLAEYVVQIATNCPGYSQWCRHQHEIQLRAVVWARAASRYYWPLGTDPKRQGTLQTEKLRASLTAVNQQRSEEAQLRIRAAVESLQSCKALPEQISRREQAIIAIAHCSKQTLRKYLCLWHPNHQLDKACTAPETADSDSVSNKVNGADKTLQPSSGQKVHTFPLMKGGAKPNDACSEKNIFSLSPEPLESTEVSKSDQNSSEAVSVSLSIQTFSSVDSFKQRIGTTTPFAPTTSVVPKRRVDDCNSNTRSTGKLQVDKAYSKIDSFSLSTLTQDDSSLSLNSRFSSSTDVRMQQWLNSGDPILVKEAQIWFDSQIALIETTPSLPA